MTMLQQQAIQIIDDMPDDKLQTLIDLMKMLIKSDHDADNFLLSFQKIIAL